MYFFLYKNAFSWIRQFGISTTIYNRSANFVKLEVICPIDSVSLLQNDVLLIDRYINSIQSEFKNR